MTDAPVGRYAPSPTGRMHLGNVFTALMSWLSVRSRSGKWVLRIEDLDPQRSKAEYARIIEDDLRWLGLDYDEGGTEDIGVNGPYSQSRRGNIYKSYLERLHNTGLTYPCTCTRADIMATQAPHQSDGRIIYSGKCRPKSLPRTWDGKHIGAVRIAVPDRDIIYTDLICGRQCVNLSRECGDFILQRSDGAWAYQLAVVVDDALMGITEVVRGNDLLLSAAQQIYLYNLLRLQPPVYAHLPLICNTDGRRLSKRDASLDMGHLREHYTATEIIGHLARIGGLIPDYTPCHPSELIGLFDWAKITRNDSLTASL